MHLHSHGSAVVEVLTGQVKVELCEVERLVAAGDGQGASFADDLDSSPDVLEYSTRLKVGNADVEVGSGDLSIDTVNQINR